MPRLAQRSRSATSFADPEHDIARRFCADAPAGVNHHRPDRGGSPQPISDDFVIQA
jgi:hypothetical protein